MKILVVGRHGQLARALRARSGAFPELALEALGRPELNLEKPGSATRAISAAAPDLVINAAAFTAVDLAEKEQARAFRINAEGAGEVARAAAAAGAGHIHISTDHVFDGSAAPYREDDPAHPLNVYGRSKLAGEEQVRAAAPDHLILRTAWLYGPSPDNFITRILAVAASGGEIVLPAGQRGCPTSAADLADALLAIASRWRAGDVSGTGATLHLAGGGATSRVALAEAVMAEAAAAGLPTAGVREALIAPGNFVAARPAYSTLDCARFARTFGFLLPPWRSALGRVIRVIAGEQG